MKYKVFCQTENEWKEVESLIIKHKCPINASHTIDESSIHITKGCCQSYDEGKLYRQLRRELIADVTQNGQNMTNDELKQASEHFATPIEVRNLFFTMDEQIILGDTFNKRATDDRKMRHDRAMSELMNYLSYLEAVEVVEDIGDLSEKYVTYGVEGTSEGDPVGLFDYFESTDGTQFENAGFLEKTFTPRNGLTIAQLSARIMGILRISI